MQTKHKPIHRLLPRECRYPVTELSPRRHRFCARPARPGSSYCDLHHRVALRPAPVMNLAELLK